MRRGEAADALLQDLVYIQPDRNGCKSSVAGGTRLSASRFLRRDHLCDAGDAGVSGVEIPLRVHGHGVGLDELPVAATRTVSDRADDTALPVHLEDLAVLSGRQ